MVNFFKISRFFLYVSVFCVIIVTSSTLFPFIVGKYVFFRGIVDLTLIFFLLGVIFSRGEWDALRVRAKQVFHHPLFIAVSIFALMFLLASLFAYDSGAAFWSNFERGDGGLQMLHFYIFFLLLSLLFRSEAEWKKIFTFSLAAAGLVILYGIATSLGVSSFIGPEGFCGRVAGSLGNPAYFAPYLMFMMFYALWLWFSKKQNPPRNVLFISLLIVLVFFFLLSQTRGAFLGLGLGVIVALLYLAFALPRGRWKKISAVLAGLCIVFAGLAFTFRQENIPLVPFCKTSSRLLDVSTSDKTAQTRLWTWGSAIKGWQERPVLGWGPENFGVVFDRHFDTRHFTPGQNSETWFDRAHSVFFDYLAETGILGLVSFLGIFVTFFWQIIKYRREFVARHHPYGYLFTALFLAIPVGYLGQGVALFDVLPIYLNVFLFLAFALHLFLEMKEKHAMEVVRHN